jgi:transcriptional regulator with XRE-family HTH domain
MSRTRKASQPVMVNTESIRRWLLDNRVTQKSLAEKIEVRPEYLGRILNGQVMPSLDILARLEDATGEPWWTFMLPSDKVVVSREEAETIRALMRGLQTFMQQKELQPV